MSVPLEQGGYVGLPKVPTMESSSETFSQRGSSSSSGLNLKATELRLGLPGSESPEREGVVGVGVGVEEKNVYPLGMLKSLVSGAKRGFSDAIDGGCSGGKWLLSSGNGGSEVGLCKDGSLFSPRGVVGAAGKGLPGTADCTNIQQASVVKDKVPQSPNPLHEKKKPQISAPAAK